MNVDFDQQDIIIELTPEGKDGRSIHPAGEWSASAAYAYLDLVSYQGSSYVALKAVPAGTLPTNTSYWMLSAEKGDPGTPVWGAITGDLSDQTDLQEALDAKADVIISSASGSIASFSDGSASPVTALSVAIEPVQDLHGYDNPWPAGGGVNLLPPMVDGTYEGNGVKAVVSNGVATLSGTTTSSGNALIIPLSSTITIPGGTVYYHLMNSVANGSVQPSIENSQDLTQEIHYNFSAVNRIASLSDKEGQTYDRIRFYLSSGVTLSGTYSPMICRDNVARSYQTYSNICPISGHTSATVTRTGKNLLPKTNKTSQENNGITFTVNNDGTITLNGTATALAVFTFISRSDQIFPIYPKGTYTFSGLPDNQSSLANNVGIIFQIKDGNANKSVAIYANDISKTETFTDRMWLDPSVNRNIYIQVKSGVSLTNFTIKPQIELGSTASNYEAPSIQTVTIDLDGTRYGGELNVLTGELTVDRGFTTFDGSDDEGWQYHPAADGIYYITVSEMKSGNNQYGLTNWMPLSNSANNLGIRIGADNNIIYCYRMFNLGISSLASWKTHLASNNLQLVYPLATPITVQLTPSQLSTLLGTNNIWADTGDIAVEYRADSKLYIDGKVAQTAKVTRQMIADSATADGKAPKSLATGDLIIVGDELRKATANIGNGSAITASNSTTATLADVIKALQ